MKLIPSCSLLITSLLVFGCNQNVATSSNSGSSNSEYPGAFRYKESNCQQGEDISQCIGELKIKSKAITVGPREKINLIIPEKTKDNPTPLSAILMVTSVDGSLVATLTGPYGGCDIDPTKFTQEDFDKLYMFTGPEDNCLFPYLVSPNLDTKTFTFTSAQPGNGSPDEFNISNLKLVFWP